MSAREAGLVLRALLEHQPEYRQIWGQHVARRRSDLSVAAVCHVLAIHLWETGERAESATELPRQLRDLVGRALAGEVLTMKTLRWFADAFSMPARDYDQLFSALTARPTRAVGGRSGPDETRHPAGTGSGLRVLHAHIEHRIGGDGLLERSEHIRCVEISPPHLEATSAVPVGAAPGGLTDLVRTLEQADLSGTESPADRPDHPAASRQRRMVRWVVGPERRTEKVGEIRQMLLARYETVTLQIRFSDRAPDLLRMALDRSGSEISAAQTLRPDDDGAFTLHLDDPGGRTACCSWTPTDGLRRLRAAG